jgi:hypothetical protein
MILLIKTCIELNDVRVVQKTLNFYLANELVYVFHLTFKNAFGYFFEGADEIGSNMPKLDCDYFAR